jgi:ribosomal protein S18 acetylase RimI-like enzyme
LLAESLTFLIAAGAHPLTLNTQADNYASQSLYRRFGYLPTGDSTTVMLRSVALRPT